MNGHMMPIGSHTDERNPKIWRTMTTNSFPVCGSFPPNVMPEEIMSDHPERLRSVDVKAATKYRHFVDLCSAYHIPIIFLTDIPGVMTGGLAERQGTLRAGLACAYSLAYAEVPIITVVIKKAFGYGGSAMGGHGAGQAAVLAWPTADFGAIPAAGGSMAAYKKEIEAAVDPEAKKRELEKQFAAVGGPYVAAANFNVDDVIDPRETRPRIIRALELALNGRSVPAAPVLRHGIMP
jgi:acetyl-CoA carboxylase carboxyltransferase component